MSGRNDLKGERMIRRYAAAAIVASTLVAAWPAAAGPKAVPESVRLCGPSACMRISDRAVPLALARSEDRSPVPPPTLALARSRPAAIAPYRARIVRVSVGNRSAADPSAYAAIVRRPAMTPPDAVWRAHSMPIGLAFAGASPWSSWDSAPYFPASRLIHVPDGAWVRVNAPRPR
jgi:hypothetical protein